MLTERDGEFVELPSGRRVDPISWLAEEFSGYVAGFLAYEFAWELLDVRASPHSTNSPRCWVGRFRARRESPSPARGGVLSELAPRVARPAYEDAVRASVAAIYAGELFEINYTARWSGRWDGSAAGMYARMTETSTGSFFGLLDAGDFAVVSASPEAFVSVERGVVETRPIKGTAPRDADPQRDHELREQLRVSEKDRAENVMIVDLMRNDLTPVCELGSVHVAGLCDVESFAGVHHLVSTVRGTLRDGVRPIDVLLRCFPAGSITGAPKLRAMELAAELEADARGAYTGTFFVATPDELRSSVLIRTATLTRHGEDDGFDVSYGAGGAVVWSSDPTTEWEEAVTKCGPLLRVMGQ